MSDIEFIEGLIFKAPREGAPEFVKAKVSIKREDLIAWLQGKDGDWINLDVKESKGGKWYAAVDTWKPEGKEAKAREPAAVVSSPGGGGGDLLPDDDIPFITNRSTF